LARRRSHYGQEKRAKELARKKKSEEKLKRRQQKDQPQEIETPEAGEKSG
jgi:hypothetical protein